MVGTLCKVLINTSQHRWVGMAEQSCHGHRVDARRQHPSRKRMAEHIHAQSTTDQRFESCELAADCPGVPRPADTIAKQRAGLYAR